ncbi:kinetochore protein NDC80 homolog [Contarinia nasturtii]|uniref:kinetochore protein NDC80 homolog n=1 Tax=Contarinia nasturtii TaxID=265458 RepID=UPI0012D43C28|nr:kinetochore protein NDC80 homolog [Contarinia nasturtii]
MTFVFRYYNHSKTKRVQISAASFLQSQNLCEMAERKELINSLRKSTSKSVTLFEKPLKRLDGVPRSWTVSRLSRDKAGLRRFSDENSLQERSRSTISTPLHSCSSAARYSTASRDNLTKSKHENIVKLQEILKRHNFSNAALNLKNDCMKSITINQFHLIMDHFVYLITGKELKTFTPNRNGGPNKKSDQKQITIEGILNFLKQVRYPHTVTKSMLKIPNAPHTFDQMVLMLLWLADIASVSTIAADEPIEKYTLASSKEMQDGYLLWGKDNSKHDVLVKRMTDNLIAAKLDNKVTSEAELQLLTENLKLKSQEFVENSVHLKKIHQFEQLESKYLEYETKEHDLIKQLKDKRDRLAALHVKMNDKRIQMRKSHGRMIECVQKREDYQRLGKQISLLKASIVTLENGKQHIKDEDFSDQIKYARIVKNVSTVISDINNRSMQIIKVLNNSQNKTVSECELNKLLLPATPSFEQVEQVNQYFLHIYSVVEIEKFKGKMKLDQAIIEMNVLKAESIALTKEIKSEQKSYDKHANDYDVLEKNAAMKNRKNENSTRDLCKQADDAKAKLQSLKDKIIAALAEEMKMKTENARIMADGEAQAKKIRAEKDRLADQMDEIDKILDEKFEGLDYPE